MKLAHLRPSVDMAPPVALVIEQRKPMTVPADAHTAAYVAAIMMEHGGMSLDQATTFYDPLGA